MATPSVLGQFVATRTRRRTTGAILAAPTALLGAAGGWWALSKHLPPLADDEWPYIGSANARRSSAHRAAVHRIAA